MVPGGTLFVKVPVGTFVNKVPPGTMFKKVPPGSVTNKHTGFHVQEVPSNTKVSPQLALGGVF